MTCPHSDKPCGNRHDCERCKVPEAYGFFLVWRKGKAEWEQRFILEKDRGATIRYYEDEIRKLEKRRSATIFLASKEDYERTKL